MKSTNLIGHRFGRLVIIGDSHKVGIRYGFRLCRCDCGRQITVVISDLRSGHTKSCGCFNLERIVERNHVHGFSGTRIHRIWRAMKTRCNNPNTENYKYYGGRGIKVCERWNCFENFLADMGEPPADMSIDRIDNDSGYSPENCRWVPHLGQMANTRRNLQITWRGKTQHVAAWAREIGCNQGFLRSVLVAWRL